tara:strand:+ start:2306 stop:3367 length:1062 start_codon:yes stop_codon:yes gene_type:complete
MKNNIVIDIRMINNSGIGTYIKNILSKVINHYKYDHFILLVNPCIDYTNIFKELDFNNFEILNIKSPIYSIHEQFEIYIKLFTYNIDLFWSTNYNIPILLQSKLLVTVHDIWHIVDKSSKRIIRRFYAKVLFYFIKIKDSNIIAVSNFTKNEIISHTKIVSNITVIKHGIEKFWKSNKSYKDSKIILYVGNIRKHKNVNLLINSFNKINIKSFKLLLVGKVDEYIKNNNSNEFNIEFIGELDRTQLVKYYNNARLLVLPSSYEGFGFTPLESMACDCPVLVSDSGSLREVCKDGVFYFDLNIEDDLKNKILYLLNNEQVCDELINNGKEVIKEYDWVKTVHETIIKIDKLLVN